MGNDAAEKIKTNWEKIVPKLLQLQTATSLEASRDKEMNALLILDKQLRSSGTVAKLPAVFSFYEVRTNMQSY